MFVYKNDFKADTPLSILKYKLCFSGNFEYLLGNQSKLFFFFFKRMLNFRSKYRWNCPLCNLNNHLITKNSSPVGTCLIQWKHLNIIKNRVRSYFFKCQSHFTNIWLKTDKAIRLQFLIKNICSSILDFSLLSER